MSNKNREEICVFVHKVSHKAGLFQFNHKLDKDASRRRDSINIFPEAEAIEDVLDQHDDIQAVSGLKLSEMFRRIVEHYIVGADYNVIDHVPDLSDGVIQFLTDS